MARTLDVIVTGIEAEAVTKRGIGIVYYGFPVGDLGILHWEIPRGSDFDLNQLAVGKRYEIATKEVGRITYFNRNTGKMDSRPEYDWVSVREIPPKAQTSTMSRKQSQQKKQADGMKPAFESGLFSGL